MKKPELEYTVPSDNVYEIYSKLSLTGKAADGNFWYVSVKVDDYEEEVFYKEGLSYDDAKWYTWNWSIKPNKVAVYTKPKPTATLMAGLRALTASKTERIR